MSGSAFSDVEAQIISEADSLNEMSSPEVIFCEKIRKVYPAEFL